MRLRGRGDFCGRFDIVKVEPIYARSEAGRVREPSEWVEAILAKREKIPIVRDGEIVGYEYPPPPLDEAEVRKSIREAGAAFDKMVKKWGVTEAQLMAEYRVIRDADRKQRGNEP